MNQSFSDSNDGPLPSIPKGTSNTAFVDYAEPVNEPSYAEITDGYLSVAGVSVNGVDKGFGAASARYASAGSGVGPAVSMQLPVGYGDGSNQPKDGGYYELEAPLYQEPLSQALYASVNAEIVNESDYDLPPLLPTGPGTGALDASHPGLEIERSRVQLLEVIGSGHYGEIRRAELAADTSVTSNKKVASWTKEKAIVAAKLIKSGSPAEEVKALLAEAILMSRVPPHANVVSVIGVLLDGGVAVLMTLCDGGSLLEHLRAGRATPASRLQVAIGTANGMAEYRPTLCQSRAKNSSFGAPGMLFLAQDAVHLCSISALNPHNPPRPQDVKHSANRCPHTLARAQLVHLCRDSAARPRPHRDTTTAARRQ